MEPHIQYAKTKDGVSIAYRTIGSGQPLVFVRGWISHLEVMWEHASYRSFFEALARARLVVQYDARGNGLSDRDVSNVGLDALLLDLEAVVDHLNLDTFDLYGQTFGGPIAVAYTGKHPRRVSKLILDGTYARGEDLASPERQAAMVGMIRNLWPAAVKTLDELTVPEADHQGMPRYNLSEAVSRDVAVELYSLAYRIDVTDLLPRLKVPTLVLHRAGSRSIRFGLGRAVASLIPDARLVPLDGTAHNPWEGDARSALVAIGDFLGEEFELEEPTPAVVPMQAPVTILFTDVEGSTAFTQRLGDAKARELLREHERMVREALKAHGGSEVKTMGDGFMASFSSATKALECAIAMQRAFAEHNESAEEPILVRIGLNAGEPIAEEDDLFGTAVNLAARICAQAEAGQILAPIVVRELAAGKQFMFADLGETELRGFEDPVRLYELRWREAG